MHGNMGIPLKGYAPGDARGLTCTTDVFTGKELYVVSGAFAVVAVIIVKTTSIVEKRIVHCVVDGGEGQARRLLAGNEKHTRSAFALGDEEELQPSNSLINPLASLLPRCKSGSMIIISPLFPIGFCFPLH